MIILALTGRSLPELKLQMKQVKELIGLVDDFLKNNRNKHSQSQQSQSGLPEYN